MTESLDPEVEAVLSALVYFAPDYGVTVEPFAVAHQRACELLYERRSSLSPNAIREAMEAWPLPAMRRHQSTTGLWLWLDHGPGLSRSEADRQRLRQKIEALDRELRRLDMERQRDR